MGSIFPETWDWESFWNITAFFSIVLAFMNLLPIPALDGGHVLFTLVEMITGKKPNQKFLEYAQMAGMIILFGLLIYANANDFLGWNK
jgi:regulator of sigma E protease